MDFNELEALKLAHQPPRPGRADQVGPQVRVRGVDRYVQRRAAALDDAVEKIGN